MMEFGYTPFGVGMVFWWGIFIYGVIMLIRWIIERSSGNRKSALDIAKERYAKGEIDAKEYEEMKRSILESSK